MEKELISVVVPVYNVKNFLNRCIDSIISQTYKNLEIILIDDGSYDGSETICDEYSNQYKNIEVIHKKNSGLSEARNVGLEKSTGKYIMFIDSDDFINEKMVETLYNNLKNENADISVCRPYLFEVEEKIPKADLEKVNQKLVTYNDVEILKHMYDDYLITVTAWNKLYKKELFNNIRYPKGGLIEDSAVIHYLLNECNRIVYSNLELYYYFQRDNSIMHELNYKLLDELDWLEDRIKFFEKLGYSNEEFFKKTIEKYFEAFSNWMYVLIKNNGYSAKHMQRYFIQYKRIYMKYGKNINYSKKKAKLMIRFQYLYYYIKGINRLVHKISVSINQNNIKQRLINRYEKYLKDIQDSPKYIIFNAPNHGNIGDHAILYAEEEFLRENNKKSISIVHDEIEYFLQKYSETIKENDIIMITGGGNLGTLWEHEQLEINKIIRKYYKNKIIIFPQTITYSDNIHGIYRREKDKVNYEKCKGLTLVCRDKKSYNFVTENFKINCLQTSDIVTYLNYSNLNKENKRKDILICLRKDKERVTSESDIKKIKRILENKFKYENIEYVDTVYKGYFTLEKGKKYLSNFIHNTSRSKLFVTDRLHGMIFAAITGTPCIAMANSNGKVKGVFEWISKENKYVKFVENIDEFETKLNELDFNKKNIYQNKDIREELRKISI